MGTFNLKYQDLINKQPVKIKCPFEGCLQGKRTGFRWIYLPIEDKLNFIPKQIYDELKGVPPRTNTPEDFILCSSCGISMFNSQESATKSYLSIPSSTRNKLGYTHLASGEISEEHGVMTGISVNGHFDLFEFEGVELRETFVTLEEIGKN